LFDCQNALDVSEADLRTESDKTAGDQRERACLVTIQFNRSQTKTKLIDVDEFSSLVTSAGVNPILHVSGTRTAPTPAYFIGKGKLEEIQQQIESQDIDVVLFNHELSPIQERNLEKVLQRRVLDRTGVILDIFAQRARSFEGKLQVELAQLKHLSTRLVRGWSHLERQKGGIGTRGPGETQLETDRRLLSLRIKQINKRLQKVNQRRQQNRQAREQAALPTVALVGYTNAGKSTLFNRLTEADVYIADQLFATLDPTLRRFELSDQRKLILADTVGFIQDLPHDLVVAFRSTLDETLQADLLLHVVDASDPERQLRVSQVNQVLAEIGAEHIPQVLVYNKIDNLPESDDLLHTEENHLGQITQVWLSAQQNKGLDLLDEGLRSHLSQQQQQYQLEIPPHAGQLRAQLYEIGQVISETYTDKGVCSLTVNLDTRHQTVLNSPNILKWHKIT